MQKIEVNTKSGSYTISLSGGILKQVGEISAELVSGRKAFVVTDENVKSFYLEEILSNLSRSGFQTFSQVIPAGEESKSQTELFKLYEAFNKAGINRSDMIVALGGGVVGDLTGFAASSWLRGCHLIQIPTSLLAQVDSSVGGKTGIDMPYGKNLVGSFYQPDAVLIDSEVLKTLPENRISEGMAEIIKYGLICDEKMFRELENGRQDLNQIIYRCVEMKRDIVEADEHDTGERMILNYGHTIGHAVEKLSGYGKMSHGECVAIGMIYASIIGEHLKLTPKGTTQRTANVLRMWNLPVTSEFEANILFETMRTDKKNLAGKIYFILLTDIGKSIIHPFTPEEMYAELSYACEEIQTLKQE